MGNKITVPHFLDKVCNFYKLMDQWFLSFSVLLSIELEVQEKYITFVQPHPCLMTMPHESLLYQLEVFRTQQYSGYAPFIGHVLDMYVLTISMDNLFML